MSANWLFLLGGIAGAGAGLLAGLIGIGGGIVVVPVIYYGLVLGGTASDQAAHVAVATSLAAILPTAIVSSIGHWRAGNTDLRFLQEWGPGIVIGVVAAQLVAPHLRGSVLTGAFGILCLAFAVRFGFADWFRPLVEEPPTGRFRAVAAAGIGVSSGLAGIGGGILTNIVMTLSGMPMHKSVGRAAAAGVAVGLPATVVAALASHGSTASQMGSIDLAMWASIAPIQATTAWLGTRLAQRTSAMGLARIMAGALALTGVTMLKPLLLS
jgi:uncharacterized protein